MPFYETEWFICITGIASVVGLAVSIVTFIFACNINHKIQKAIDKKVDIDYLKANCKGNMKMLQAIQDNIRKDNIFNSEMAGKINKIITLFEELLYVLNSKGKKKIKNYIKRIKCLINKNELTLEEMNEVANKLDLLILKLDKEKTYGQR